MQCKVKYNLLNQLLLKLKYEYADKPDLLDNFL
jgi:hypothetical protein